MKIYIGETRGKVSEGEFVSREYLGRYAEKFIPKLETLFFDRNYPDPFTVEKIVTVEYDSEKHGSPSQWKKHGINHRTETDKDGYERDVRDEKRRYWFVDYHEDHLIDILPKLTALCLYDEESVVIGVHDDFQTLAFYKDNIGGFMGDTWTTLGVGLWEL